MPDYTSEPAVQAIIQSPKFAEFSPDKRKEFLTDLGNLTPDERVQFAQGVGAFQRTQLEGNDTNPLGGGFSAATEGTPPPGPRREAGTRFFTKDLPATALDVAGQIGGTAAGSYIGAPMLGTVAGGYLANQVNKALGFREGQPFTTVDTGDVLNALVPVVHKTASMLYRGPLTSPARQAITKSDAVNEANTADYTKNVQKTSMDLQERVARAEDAVDARNQASNVKWAKAQQAWANEPTKINQEYFQKVGDIQRNTALDNTEKALEVQRLTAERDAQLQAHTQAGVENRTGKATQAAPPADYQKSYDDAFKAADTATPIDVGSLNKLGEKAATALVSPVTGNNPASGIATRVAAWGEGQPVSLRDLLEVHQDLGQALRTAKGEQYDAVRTMYKEVNRLMAEAAASGDPAAKTAVESYRAGQAGWSRNKMLQDVQILVDRNTVKTGPDTYEVNRKPIINKLDEWSDPGRYDWAGSLEPKEWQAIKDYANSLPEAKPSHTPTAQPPATPNRAIDEAAIQRDRALAAHAQEPAPTQPTPEQVNYDDYSANWPEPKDTVTPNVGKFPIAQAILGKMTAAEGSNLVGFTGSNSDYGLVRLGGAVAGTLPWGVSKFMLATPEREQIVRQIIAGQGGLTPMAVAHITAVATALQRQSGRNVVK